MLLLSLVHSLQLKSTNNFLGVMDPLNYMVNGTLDAHDKDGTTFFSSGRELTPPGDLDLSFLSTPLLPHTFMLPSSPPTATRPWTGSTAMHSGDETGPWCTVSL